MYTCVKNLGDKTNNIICFSLILLVFSNLIFLFKIPYLFLFTYCIFIIFPGWLLIKIFRLGINNFIELILISIGLSIFFIYSLGLCINFLYPCIGIMDPLSATSVQITFSVSILLLSTVAWKLNNNYHLKFDEIKFNVIEKRELIIPSLLPLIAIIGTILMNKYDINYISILYYLIVIIVVIRCTVKPQCNDKILPTVLIFISLSQLLIWGLRSNHLMFMTDTDQEFFYYNLTLLNQGWNAFPSNVVNGCLSVTLLPVIFKGFMGLSSEILFRILFPLILSIIPIIVYKIANNFLSSKMSFLCSFYFISFYNFFSTNVRVNVAILFFSLIIMLIFSNNINTITKKILLIVFSFSCLVSHYSTGYILFFIMIIYWITKIVLDRRLNGDNRNDSNKIISLSTVLLYLGLLILWFLYVVGSAFNAGITIIYNTLIEMNKLFVSDSRSVYLQVATGAGTRNSGIAEQIEVGITWLIVIIIVVGLICTLKNLFLKRPNRIDIVDSSMIGSTVNKEYIYFSIVAMGIFLFSAIAPYISFVYDFVRTYYQMLIILIIYLPMGLIRILRRIKINPIYIILLILILYFSSTSGLTYQMAGTQKSIILNSTGTQYDDLYIHDQESYSSKWLSVYIDDSTNNIRTDYLGRFRLIIEGLFNPPTVINHLADGDNHEIVYLRYINVNENKIINSNMEYNSLSDYDYFNNKNKIYNNEGSAIYD